jgi:hypothetical protein
MMRTSGSFPCRGGDAGKCRVRKYTGYLRRYEEHAYFRVFAG